MSTSQDDELIDLLNRAKQGDVEARLELVVELVPPLRRFAWSEVGERPDAADLVDDLVQDAAIRIVDRLDQCQAQSERQLINWALTIIRNIYHDLLRAERKIEWVRFSPRLYETVGTEVEHALLTESEKSSVDKAFRSILHKVWASLSENQVRLLTVRLDEEATWPEVATKLKIRSDFAARRRFQRIQLSIRKDLQRRLSELPTTVRDEVRRRFQRMGF